MFAFDGRKHVELYRREQLKLFTVFQHNMNLAILEKNVCFPALFLGKRREGSKREK